MENNSGMFERALIGALMKLGNSETKISEFVMSALKPASFYHMTYREIFKTITALYQTGNYFDVLSVIKAMQNNPSVSAVDIDKCYEFRASEALIREYCKKIKDLAIERFAIARISDVADMISNQDNGTIQERIGLAESVIDGLIDSIQGRDQRGFKDGFKLSNEWLDEVEAYGKGEESCFDFGIQGLDSIIKPKMIKAGSLIVVGARPKMGKTFFLTRIAEHYIKNRNQTVCLFSMEMRGSDIWERMLSGYAKINSDMFYTTPQDNTKFWDRLGTLNCELANKKIFVDDRAGKTVDEIKAQVRDVHRQTPVSVIGVDYLTLMDGEDAERNDLKYAKITKELKKLAKELNCVIILLTQLNRNLENRVDKRPMPSDSRDTGQIEQDCDIWIGLYRESVYNMNCGHNLTEAIIRLNRVGGSGTAYMTLSNGYFEDVSEVDANYMLEESSRRQGGNKNESGSYQTKS